ncbi:MAG: rhombosortase [Pseudomonadota bacterium]
MPKLIKLWWFPACLAALSAVLQFTGQRDLWQFDRAAIDGGAWWLLFTGNLVHLNTGHLALNLLGLSVIVLLVWHHLRTPQWLACFAISAAAVGVGLYLRDPELSYYVGLSGVLHGLLLAGIIIDVAKDPRGGWILLAAIVAKLGWEQWHGAVPGSEWAAGGTVVVNSHLYGAVAGAVVGVVILAWRTLGGSSRGRA